MTNIEYFKYSIRKGYLTDINWYFAILGQHFKDNTNKYVSVKDGVITVNVDDVYIPLEGTGDAVLTIYDKVTLTHDELSNISIDTPTDVGIAIANYTLITHCFGNKIDYMNGVVNNKKIESIVGKLMVAETITVDELKQYIINCSFLTGIAELVNLSATPTNIVGAPGISEYKQEAIQILLDKYGPDWSKDYTKVKEFENMLTAFDEEYLKDDLSLNKLVSGKVKGVGRTKQFLMYGAESGFDTTGTASTITNSLSEGWGTDPKNLAVMFNASRAGSYFRGAETIKGGVAAKVILRATSSIIIVPDTDCGSVLGKPVEVTKIVTPYLIGRTMLLNNKKVMLTEDNISEKLYEKIIVRSPQYCLLPGSSYCSTCVGKSLERYLEGISLTMTDISKAILDISMASMHGKELQVIEIDMKQMISK